MRIVLVLLLSIMVSCKSATPPLETEDQEPQDPIDIRVTMGTIADNRINEASGLVASRKNPDVLWVHNDSGDGPRVFGINTEGALVGVYTLQGAQARDWEDIALGPGPDPNRDYLYLADVGDNNTIYSNIVIYRIEEPTVSADQSPEEVEVDVEHRFTFTYPDRQHNAETVWVDPEGPTFFVMTKEGRTELVFSRSLHPPEEVSQPLIPAGEFTFPDASIIAETATAGDLSPDASRLLVKSYGRIFMWERTDLSASFFSNAPITLPYVPEPQGEAIAWAPDGAGYFTLSEEPNNEEAVLYYYPYQP